MLVVFVVVILAAGLAVAAWAVEAIVAPEPELALGVAAEPPADPNIAAFIVLPAVLAIAGVVLAGAAIRALAAGRAAQTGA